MFLIIIVIDGTINVIPVVNNVGTFYGPIPNNYAFNVTGNL
jgi:hypothetical protein